MDKLLPTGDEKGMKSDKKQDFSDKTKSADLSKGKEGQADLKQSDLKGDKN